MRPLPLAALCVLACVTTTLGDDEPANDPLDPAVAKIATMIGGVRRNGNEAFPIEFRYTWTADRKGVKGAGVIGKGTPNEAHVESVFGFDPHHKTAYYLDLHGSQEVYKGTMKLDGETLVLDFETLVGKPAKWRSRASFPDHDTYKFTIHAQKDGEWKPVVESPLKRSDPK